MQEENYPHIQEPVDTEVEIEDTQDNELRGETNGFDSAEKPPSSNKTKWIILSIVAVIVIAIIIFLFKNKKNKPEPEIVKSDVAEEAKPNAFEHDVDHDGISDEKRSRAGYK